MRKAIHTKFLPCGAVKGARIKATDGDNSITLGYDHAQSHDKRHAAVAFALVQKMHEKAKGGWAGFYVAGSNKNGNTFVNVAQERNAVLMLRHASLVEKPFGFEGVDWFFVSDDEAKDLSTNFEGL